MKQFLDIKGVQCDLGNKRSIFIDFIVSLEHRYIHVRCHIICQKLSK